MMPHDDRHSDGVRNNLLAGLPNDVRAKLLPKLSNVTLPIRQVLYAAEAPIEFVYFPEDSVISMVATLQDGGMAEVGLIGREGMAGTPLLSGVKTAFTEAMVQIAGTALRMAAGSFAHELDENPTLKAALLRYNEYLTAQISQTSACNGRHGLEQRLARWLLMAHDRIAGDDLPLTQEFIAMMLGVHRPSISVTAGILQRSGLIRYSGGLITVVDRHSLEAASCECYAAVQRRSDRLLGPQSRIAM
jgi:CRP-like cAMP-binding protein